MPRPNRPRSITSEERVAFRVRQELDEREMKPATLAQAMTEAGCPINTSAIYRILSEDDEPRRRITVDELVAIANVFEVAVEELLSSPAAVREQRLARLLTSWEKARRSLRPHVRREREAWGRLVEYARGEVLDDDTESRLAGLVLEWARENYPEDQHRLALGGKMYDLTSNGWWLDYQTGKVDFAEPVER